MNSVKEKDQKGQREVDETSLTYSCEGETKKNGV
jgi:hypothetical protein